MSDHELGPRASNLGDTELDCLTTGHCPACGYRGFVIGPGAFPSDEAQQVLGMPAMFQVNIECGSVDCRSRYNVTFRSGAVLFAQDLFDGRSRPPWPSEPG